MTIGGSGNAKEKSGGREVKVSEVVTAAVVVKESASKNGFDPLEEDDEFEDFPMDDWEEEDSAVPQEDSHLWEESWDDDDAQEDFAQELRNEMRLVEAASKSP